MIADRLIARAQQRPPDFVVGGDNPYLLRWWLCRYKRWLPVAYLHCFLRSDSDRALHDHPFGYVSLILRGSYVEHTIRQGGIHQRKRYSEGDVLWRLDGRFAHRIEIDKPCWTLFLRGPFYRQWGFHLASGWVHHKDFEGNGE